MAKISDFIGHSKLHTHYAWLGKYLHCSIKLLFLKSCINLVYGTKMRTFSLSAIQQKKEAVLLYTLFKADVFIVYALA